MAAIDEYYSCKREYETWLENERRAKTIRENKVSEKAASQSRLEAYQKEKKIAETRRDEVSEIIRKMNSDVLSSMQKSDSGSISLEVFFKYSMELLGTVAAEISNIWGSKVGSAENSVIEDLQKEYKKLEDDLIQLTSNINRELSLISTCETHISVCDKTIETSRTEGNRSYDEMQYWKSRMNEEN